MFGVSGAALSKIRHMQNGGKRPRHSVDQWDRQSTFLFHRHNMSTNAEAGICNLR